MTLGCLWSEEAEECEVRWRKNIGREGLDAPGMLAGRADTAREHQVELLRFSNLVVCVRIPYVVFFAQFTQFWTRIVV